MSKLSNKFIFLIAIPVLILGFSAGIAYFYQMFFLCYLNLVGIVVFGVFAFSIGRAIFKPLNQIIRSLSQGIHQVSSASVQLSASSQELSSASSEQASAIDETLTVFEETASTLSQNNSNTMQAAQLSEQAQASADKGGMEMQEMISSMGEIKKSSDQIAKIIKVIDDIAFQTNILALNAAIEAARAGEAGLGFAVVAEEVRNLAQKSAQAAKDTADIIELNINLSGKGVTVSQKAREALSEITANSKKVNELMSEISTASQEQAQGIDQINIAMAQVAVITQQNAATAEENAAAAEELNAQANSMKKIVNELAELVSGKMFAFKMEAEYSAKEYQPNEAASVVTTPVEDADSGTKIVSPEDIIPLEKDSRF